MVAAWEKIQRALAAGRSSSMTRKAEWLLPFPLCHRRANWTATTPIATTLRL